MANTKLVSLVIPAYNEGAAILDTLAEIEAVLLNAPKEFHWEVVVVNDGSRDQTLDLLQSYLPNSFSLSVVDLSRNFGKEAALSAGLSIAKGDAVIPLDADLQDPPALILQMLPLWIGGAEVVLARRGDRSTDSALKRLSAGMFYRVINKISDVPIPDNVGDFRLMDRAVVNAINALPENRRFMKGLFAWAGFRTTTLEYSRPERNHGETKFNGIRLLSLAVEGVTSFSTVPLRAATYLGATVAFLAIILSIYTVLRTLVFGIDVPGYASLVSLLAFLSGIQLLALGVIGEYVGRIYQESKSRPPFLIRNVQSIAKSNKL